MSKTKQHQDYQEDQQGLVKRVLGSRLFKSFLIGLAISLLSMVIVGFNLSTNSGIRINDSINRYFDTCVGEFFTSTTPRIKTDEKGFPLAYIQTSHIPVCNDRNQPSAEVQWSAETYFEVGAFASNVLFWTCVAFVIMRSYIRRRHIKINRLA